MSLLDDDIAEDSETFELHITDIETEHATPDPARSLPAATGIYATGTIVDDEPTVSIEGPADPVEEGNILSFEVTISALPAAGDRP